MYAAYRVSSRDSGKTAVDAALGEVMVTCEKIWWLLKNGQKWLKPEYRSAGIMVCCCFLPYASAHCMLIVNMCCTALHATDKFANGRNPATSTLCLKVLQNFLKVARLAIASFCNSSAILECHCM